jgi:ER lumen protein retaining receptor
MDWLVPGWSIFRYLADFSHLISVCILLYKMLSARTCNGLSLKTQGLYLIVFVSRYCNQYLFGPPLYNTVFKLFYISSAAAICLLMMTTLKDTYSKRHDTFRILGILIPCAIAALIMMPQARPLYFFNAFSLWVESLAIFPQLILLGRTTGLDVLNREYLFFLGIYRVFYILNWIAKGLTEGGGKTPLVVWITAVIQTLVYSDFLYVYVKMKITGKEFALPYGQK